MEKSFLSQIQSFLDSTAGPPEKAERLAEAIRLARSYRWVGIYDVGEQEISVIGWSGIGRPNLPSLTGHQGPQRRGSLFPDHRGCEQRIGRSPLSYNLEQHTIGDRCSCHSSHTQTVNGTIDVESIKKNSFLDAVRTFLEDCAVAIVKLWD